MSGEKERNLERGREEGAGDFLECNQATQDLQNLNYGGHAWTSVLNIYRGHRLVR